MIFKSFTILMIFFNIYVIIKFYIIGFNRLYILNKLLFI